MPDDITDQNTDIDTVFNNTPEPAGSSQNAESSNQPEGGEGASSQKSTPQANQNPNDSSQPSGNQPAPIDAENLIKNTAEAVAKAMAKPAGNEGNKPMTEAEYNKIYQRSVVSQDDINTLFSAEATPAEKIATLQKLLDATAQHAVIRAKFISDFAVQQAIKQYQENIAPIMSRYNAEQSKEVSNAFFKAYPGFNQTTHKEILKAAAISLQQEINSMPKEKQAAMKPADVYKALADRASAIIKQINANFDPTKAVEGGTVTTAVPSATPKSFPARAKVNNVVSNKSTEDQYDDLFSDH